MCDIKKVSTARKLTDAVKFDFIFQGASEGLINVLAVGVVLAEMIQFERAIK